MGRRAGLRSDWLRGQRPKRLGQALTFAALLPGCASLAQAPQPPILPTNATEAGSTGDPFLRIYTRKQTLVPGAPEETRAGRLELVSALSLTAYDDRFGGFSGLALIPGTDRFIAVSDRAGWLTGTLRFDEGRLAGIEKAQMSALVDQQGQPFAEKRAGDAEGLALAPSTTRPGGFDALVSFEFDHRILRYPLNQDLQPGTPTLIMGAEPFGRLASNGGLEALARSPLAEGDLFAGVENPKSVRGEPFYRLFRLPADGSDVEEFTLPGDGDFRLTDFAFAPSGTLYTVERFFGGLGNLAIQFRKVSGLTGAQPQPAPQIDFLGRIALPSTIDNMEGLAVRKTPAGETELLVLSDDNFNALQRTLLMQFRVLPPTT